MAFADQVTMLPLRVLFGVTLALASPDCEVGWGYEGRGEPSSTNIKSFKDCQASCHDHDQCAHFTYDYETQECWLLGKEAKLSSEVSSISGAMQCQLPKYDRVTETEEQRNKRIHRMVASMAGNVAKRSKDKVVIGVAKHMEYAARDGYLAQEKYNNLVVVLNAAIADMDSESIGKATSSGHQVLTRDDLNWLLGHMEGIKGPPPRPDEMHTPDTDTDSKSASGTGGLHSAGEPWTNAEVKYCYDKYISLSAKNAVDCAIGKIREELPGIHFTNVGYKGRGACNTHPAIFIQSRDSGCWSNIGMQTSELMTMMGLTGNQKLNLQVPGCNDCGTAIHEMLHSMGMAPELTRPDRGSFVEIQWANVKSSEFSQFTKNPHADTSLDYDIMSIMHFGKFAFSATGKETIVVKDAGYHLYTSNPDEYHLYVIGQRNMMTKNDVLQLAKMYGCTSKTSCGIRSTEPPTTEERGEVYYQEGFFNMAGNQSAVYVICGAVAVLVITVALVCCFCNRSQKKSEETRPMLGGP
ncbi:unnamed protein product [Cladocopium goreaui]|uniref:Metalloendopeptidase n=1 Tax=Cladocopium goreaui TaxID=2562237 RepID=A0A9P1G134_9DINO|nr:unnamed protein product [Cladocopium goreaui]